NSFWMVTLKAHILPHHDLQPPGCRGSRELANNLHYFCFAITNRPEQVHFKAKALPNFYPQYHIVSRK
ncbi:hypothetical protein PO527_25610, partial [Escherichia coli]